MQQNNSKNSYESIAEMYGEYVYALGLLNKKYQRGLMSNTECKKKVFLSYQSKDVDFATLLAADLKSLGVDVWFAPLNIKLGESIPEKINEGLDACDALLMIISKNYLSSNYCGDEWKSYYMKFRNLGKYHILPIIIDEVEPPTLISDRKYVRYSHEQQNYEQILNEILQLISAI